MNKPSRVLQEKFSSLIYRLHLRGRGVSNGGRVIWTINFSHVNFWIFHLRFNAKIFRLAIAHINVFFLTILDFLKMIYNKLWNLKCSKKCSIYIYSLFINHVYEWNWILLKIRTQKFYLYKKKQGRRASRAVSLGAHPTGQFSALDKSPDEFM